jgi:ABC-type transport system substrate-binding protein
LATIITGTPGPLDPTPITSDMLSEIAQLFYETLYIFGADFSIAPLLASALPEISDGGKRYVSNASSCPEWGLHCWDQGEQMAQAFNP